ncbi:MAG: winged helix-turn-helix transcriptional regulator [Candidatus Helarchaeota archaeon]|nr:winged helix-turn-helix transcriptional regulator [Candidatus Helarchaeota archaeon]
MDGIDFAISMALMQNSRIPYRKFAEDFNMSVNSIHKRVKKMVELGIIQKFTTQISGFFIPFINVLMFGPSNAESREELLQELGANENIYNVTQASGNYLYIHSRLRNLNELDSQISFVKRVGKIDELIVGLDKDSPINYSNYFEKITLSKLDYLIINALKDNSRKLISEIADEVGTSVKTVKRHLNRLVEKNVVQFSIDWYPDKTGIILAMFQLKLKPNIDRTKVKEKLRNKYGQTIIFTWEFSNHPDLLLSCAWANTLKDLQNFEVSLKSKDIESVTVSLLFRGEMFPTWQNQYLEDKMKELVNGSS